MRKITLSILMLLISSLMAFTYAQVDVTFQVDMSQQSVSPDGVTVAGDFQDEAGYPADWAPGVIFLTEGTPGIYSVTVQLPAGTYAYKYVNGIAWGQDEFVPGGCAVGGNRQLTVGTDPVVLDAVCYGSCVVCAAPEAEVTFQVNMADQDVTAGVFIAGSFQSWNPTASQMTLSHDAVYSFTTMLTVGDYFEYKFINGSNWENVPGGCAQNGNRFLTVPEGGVTIDPICYGACVDCAAPEVEITFQVDMNNETISPDGIHIAGSFQSWQPGNTPMTDAGNGVYTYTTSLPIGDYIEYKFVNGNSWDAPQPEQVPDECGTYTNRYLTVPDFNTILNPVCFASCGPCEGAGGGATDLFFSEYAEGAGGNNKYVEVFNGTGSIVDLSQYMIRLATNGGSWGNTLNMEGMLSDGEVYVVANSGSIQAILDETDITSNIAFYNGDDAVGLFKDGVLIDAIGVQGVDPGSSWPVAGVSNGTVDHTLVRKPDVCSPTIDWASSAGTDADNSEWIVYAANTWDYIGFHVANCGSGGGGTPIAATPAFSYPSGLYSAAIDVEITCETPGATIFYTLDGSDPDQSSMEYTGAINISTPTSVKAFAVSIGYLSSGIATANYDFTVDVANLAELRSLLGGTDYYRITGEIFMTFQQNFYGQKFFQDATAGVLIYDPAGKITTPYSIGDGITGMIGTLSEYGGMIEFIPALDPGVASSTGNVIVPEVITISEMTSNFEDYESELVQILGVSFVDAGAVFANGIVYGINDASKADGEFRTTFYDMDYIGTTIPSDAADVTGICNSRSEGNYISSRNLLDIVVPPYLNLSAPNGGEQIEQGTDFVISWESNLTETMLTIELINDQTKASEVLAENVAVEDFAFTWTADQAIGDSYKVSISAAGKFLGDISENYFSIVPPFDIKITEIMYNPPEAGNDSLEFIEIYNNGLGAVNLLDWQFTKGVVFSFPEHSLNPGEFAVVCINASAFLNTFGLDAFQWTSGSLSNSGEALELSDNISGVRTAVTFDDGGSWPTEPDGFGPSLTFCDPSLNNGDAANWSSSTSLAAINSAGAGIYCTPMTGCNESQALATMYNSGWSGISSNLDPGKISMEDLFAPAYGNMTILLGQHGIFWPVQNINTLGEWNSYEGYKVKFSGSTYFVFSGTELGDKIYNYEAGISWVPVLSDGAVSVTDLIVPLLDDVDFMYDMNTGLVYWPAGGIVPGVNGALETLEPGFAYLTRFNAAGSIDFGATLPKTSTTPATAFVNNTIWNNVAQTGIQHILSIAGSALQTLEAGDVIGAFNAEGLCVGMVQFTGEENVLPLVVYGNDITTEAVDGMIEGETLNFNIYRNGETLDATAIYNLAIQNHDGIFAENGLSMVSAFKLGATGIGTQQASHSIYPNPGNGQFNIDVAGTFDVTVTNAQGQLVYKGQINNNSVINLSNQPEGIYFIQLISETATSIEKVIIE